MNKNENFKPLVYTSKLSIKGESVTFELPKNIIKYLDVNNSKIYWVPINGIIQITGKEPNIFIPIGSIDKNSFIPQS